MDEVKIKYEYGLDSMDVINVVETIGYELRHFGLTIEFLEGGDCYEEFMIKRI